MVSKWMTKLIRNKRATLKKDNGAKTSEELKK